MVKQLCAGVAATLLLVSGATQACFSFNSDGSRMLWEGQADAGNVPAKAWENAVISVFSTNAKRAKKDISNALTKKVDTSHIKRAEE